jgi:hypothetical protein
MPRVVFSVWCSDRETEQHRRRKWIDDQITKHACRRRLAEIVISTADAIEDFEDGALATTSFFGHFWIHGNNPVFGHCFQPAASREGDPPFIESMETSA